MSKRGPTRRTFAALLGITPVAAPVAARAAAQDAVFRMPGRLATVAPYDPDDHSSYAVDAATGGGPQGKVAPADKLKRLIETYAKRRAAVALNGGNLPEPIEKRLRENARSITTIDPNIAGMRSWSLSAKFARQMELEYQRSREALLNGDAWRFSNAFYLLNGNKLWAEAAFSDGDDENQL